MRLVATLAVVPALLLQTAGGRAQDRGPHTAPYTYEGTVRTVQPKPASLELITGVGMALRLVRMSVPAAAHIESGGAAIALRDLRPGDVVRAECHQTHAGLVADRIERKRAAP
jgi:hypothetical protein